MTMLTHGEVLGGSLAPGSECSVFGSLGSPAMGSRVVQQVRPVQQPALYSASNVTSCFSIACQKLLHDGIDSHIRTISAKLRPPKPTCKLFGEKQENCMSLLGIATSVVSFETGLI